MIPQIIGAVSGRVTFSPYPSFTYAVNNNQIVGNTDGIPAVRQAVNHILSTERYAYPIYDRNYGSELEQYIGRGFPFLQATIEDTLRDALLQDDRITAVNVTRIEKTGADSALVEFSAACSHGTFQTEVTVGV